MAKKRADWVVMGGKPGEIGYCTRCGDGLSINLPQRMEVVIAATAAFAKAHADCAPGTFIEKPALTPDEWMNSRDTGLSSKTIFGVMMNRTVEWASAPSDPSDFGRCCRLLKLFPAWRPRLGEVVERYPEWKLLVANWDEIAALYEEELPLGTAPKTYELMKCLIAQTEEVCLG